MNKLVLVIVMTIGIIVPAEAGGCIREVGGGCSANMIINAVIDNLRQLPPLEAFPECARMALDCNGSYLDATPEELVVACSMPEMLCCGLAQPYMGMTFEETLPDLQPAAGDLSSMPIESFEVFE